MRWTHLFVAVQNRLGRLLAALALVVMLLPIPASAGESPNGAVAVPWPATFSEYTMADGSAIVDAQDNNPDYSDIWGGSADSLPSTYFASDGANIFIRLRIRGNPEKKGLQSTVFLVSIAAGGTQAAVIGLNGKPSSVDFVYAGNADGTVIQQVYTTPFTNDGSGTSAGARWSSAPDEGYFVDFQVPISAVTAVAPSVTPTTPIQMFFGTSQAANLSVINKDYMIGSDVSYVDLSVITLSGAPPAADPTAPTAGDDTATVPQDGSVVIDLAANDSDVDGDLDPSTTALNTSPPNGTAINNADGTVTYTPDSGYAGPDSFTYTICDGAGLCDSATVSITVESSNQAPTASADSVFVAEDGSVLVDAAANDTDVDGNLDPASAVIAVPPSNGTVTNNGDGTFSYTPDADYFGPDSFTYTICDTAGSCDSATAAITVNPVNDQPVAGSDVVSVLEDGSVLVDAAANDTDVDGNLDPASAVIAVPPSNGTVTNNGDGTFSYTPDADYFGPDSFTYTICDTGGLCDSATTSITVNPVNDQPVATDDVFNLPEDTTAPLDVLANDFDIDGDLLTITGYDSVSTAGGAVSCVAGSCTYTPLPDFSGPDSFSYTVADGNGGTSTATVTLNVIGVNDPPGIVDDPVSTDEDVPLIVVVLANDTDPEGDALVIDYFTQPPNGTVTDTGSGTLTYTPDFNFNGVDAFTYRACDDGTPALCDEATVAVTVNALNDAPLGGADAAATDEDVLVVFNVLANDFDPDGDALFVSTYDIASVAGGTVSCTLAGSCTYDPPALYSGQDSFAYTIDDGNGGVDTVTVNIDIGPVNNRPDAGDDSAGATEDTPATFLAAALLVNDSDPDIDPLTITAVTSGANGTSTIVGGDIVYSPAPDFFGTDTIVYTVCDPSGLCDTAEIAITVTPDNDDPVAKDDTATTDEDVPVTVDVLANDADVDGDLLAVTLISTDPANGSAVVNGDNTITYTPAPDYFGVDNFEYQITDGAGGITTAWVQFVTVNPVNDAPLAGPDGANVDEDASVTIDLVANDSDVDDISLAIVSLTIPANGSVVDNGGGTVTYTPNPDYSGPESFSYTVCDPGGLCDTETVTVTIDPVNDAPVVVDDIAVGAEDSLVIVDVVANDTDIDGDVLSVVGVTNGTNGTVTINTDGTLTYTPDPDFFGTDTFTYTVSDGTLNVTGTASVTVAPVNDAPTVLNDVAVGAEDSLVIVDVVANDTDVDGDILSVVAVTNGTNGTVTINTDGTLTYTPDPDFFGTDTFTYTVSDGTLNVTGTASVTVAPVNDAPVVVDDIAIGAEDSLVIVDVVANDTDIDGDVLSVVGVTDGTNGTVTINTDGTLTYTPDPDFFGTDSFTYTANDGAANAVGTVVITVTGVNDPPTTPGAPALVAGLGELPPALVVGDPDGDTVTVSVVDGSLPPGITLNPDGSWGGAATEQGVFSFTVEICDQSLACSLVVLSISIELLPATGISVELIAGVGLVLLLLGWTTIRRSDAIAARLGPQG